MKEETLTIAPATALLHKNKACSNRLAFIAVLVLSTPAAYGQQLTTTNNATSGSKQTFTLNVTQVHGVSSSATMTPDYIVETKANLIVGPDSYTRQNATDGTTASLNPNGTTGLNSNGLGADMRIDYQNGTEYGVTIKPRNTSELLDSQRQRALSTASGQSSGSTSTIITVDSTQSSFINSFVDTLTR